jgi:hypothetical protein
MMKRKSAMSAIEPRFDGEGYTIIAWANGEKVMGFRQFGSYQGEWLMLTKGEKEYFVYKDWYGSCSGCDAYEGENWGDYPRRFTSADDRRPTMSQAREFAKGYKSFIEIPIKTMQELLKNGTLRSVFPANIKKRDDDIDYDEFVDDAILSCKLEEGMEVTVQNILKCTNQEIKQRALRAFGYEKFVAEAKMKEIDSSGESKLLKSGDVVFAYVKDASTTRKYLLRVPPHMKSLHEAIAWTFGMFGRDYQPLRET